MASMFEQPRNAGTLCQYLVQSHSNEGKNGSNPIVQSLVVRRLVEQISEIRMVLRLSTEPVAKFALTPEPVMATQSIANVVKSSFGPLGLDKMMVDDIGVRFLEKLVTLGLR